MMYVNHHTMPCEHAGADSGNQLGSHGATVDATRLHATMPGSSKQAKQAESDGLDGLDEREKMTGKERDPDDRYQAKDRNHEKEE
jgi:hypothetical protein